MILINASRTKFICSRNRILVQFLLLTHGLLSKLSICRSLGNYSLPPSAKQIEFLGLIGTVTIYILLEQFIQVLFSQFLKYFRSHHFLAFLLSLTIHIKRVPSQRR